MVSVSPDATAWGVAIATVRAVPAAVASLDTTTAVPEVWVTMVVPRGRPGAWISDPTSPDTNAAVAEVTVVDPKVVTPSVTTREIGRKNQRFPPVNASKMPMYLAVLDHEVLHVGKAKELRVIE
jgi:hypothetical protein